LYRRKAGGNHLLSTVKDELPLRKKGARDWPISQGRPTSGLSHPVDGSTNFSADNGTQGGKMAIRMRIRRGRLPRAAGVALLIAAVPAAFAADDATAGKALFEGNSVQPCIACHGNVENRRNAIDPGGDLDFDLVYATFLNAIATVPAMNQFDTGLIEQQKRNIAAYIADVPKARPNLVDFGASSTGNETAAQTITFSNAVTASAPLTLGQVGLTGSNADFIIKTNGTTCANNQQLAAEASCDVNVSFQTSTGSTKVALLHFPYTQAGTMTDRTAQLTGTVANQPPASSAATSGGGGALGAVWAALLLLAAGLRRRAEAP
jgi:cytochrome c553